MAGKILLLAVFGAVVALLLQSTTAATYTVGDALGWTVPPTGPQTYPNWAAPITFVVGDILVFNFVAGAHDVATVTKQAYDSCNTNSPITMQTISPVAFLLNSTGEFNFICTFGTHCSIGQKFSINVTSAAPSPTSPAPATPPPSLTPTAPTPAPVPSSPSPPPSASSPPPMQLAPGLPPAAPPAGSPNPTTSPPPAAVPPPGSSPPSPPTTTPTPPTDVSSPPPPSSATRTLTLVGFMGTLLAIAMGLTL